MSENDFECLASTGVNTPETISPKSTWGLTQTVSTAQLALQER
jgi:hypothetical protein